MITGSDHKDALRMHYKSLRKTHENYAKDVCFLSSFKAWMCHVIPLQQPLNVAVYIGFEGEASPTSITQYLWSERQKVMLPKMLSATEMTFLEYYPETSLMKNTFGFFEPSMMHGDASPVIDLMIMPLLAFDLCGNRLGFGKGHYDRYFGKIRSHNDHIPFKVGLAFDYQQAEKISSEPHDEKLEAVLLPDHYITFPPPIDNTAI